MTEKEVFNITERRSTRLEWLGMGVNSLLGMLGSDRACRRLFRQVIINYHKGYPVDPPEPEKLAKINAAPVNRTRPFIVAYPPLGSFGHTNYPVMVTYGDDDAYGKSREFVYERFPEARFEVIAGMRTYTLETQSGCLSKTPEGFLFNLICRPGNEFSFSRVPIIVTEYRLERTTFNKSMQTA